jgi:hypothetical protein
MKLYVVEVFVTYPDYVGRDSDFTLLVQSETKEEALEFAKERMNVDYPESNHLPGEKLVYFAKGFLPSDKPGVLQEV